MASKPKRPRKTKTATPRDPVDSALALFADRGYGNVALADIAAEAGLPLADLLRQFGGKNGLIAAWLGRIDAAMLEVGPAPEETPRDRLFEVVMGRLDRLAPHKALVGALGREAARDPAGLGCTLALALGRSLRWMLAAAGIEAEGLRGLLVRQGLAAIYADTLRVWLRDDSADAAKTMAHLDKRLRQAAGLLARLPQRSSRGATVTEMH